MSTLPIESKKSHLVQFVIIIVIVLSVFVGVKAFLYYKNTNVSLTITSPKEGELFSFDVQIPVTWNMNYNSASSTIIVYLNTYKTSGHNNVYYSNPVIGKSGLNQFTLPSNAISSIEGRDYINGQYTITVCDSDPVGYSSKPLCSFPSAPFYISSPKNSLCVPAGEDLYGASSECCSGLKAHFPPGYVGEGICGPISQ